MNETKELLKKMKSKVIPWMDEHYARQLKNGESSIYQMFSEMSDEEIKHWHHMVRQTRTQRLKYPYMVKGIPWAYERKLRLSSACHIRPICLHSLWKLPPKFGAGCERCMNLGLDVWDHPTFWNKDGRLSVIVLHPYTTVERARPLAEKYAHDLLLDVRVGHSDDKFHLGRSAVPLVFTREESHSFSTREWKARLAEVKSFSS